MGLLAGPTMLLRQRINKYTELLLIQSVKSCTPAHVILLYNYPIKRMLILIMKDNENHTVTKHKAGTKEIEHSTIFKYQKGCCMHTLQN